MFEIHIKEIQELGFSVSVTEGPLGFVAVATHSNKESIIAEGPEDSVAVQRLRQAIAKKIADENPDNGGWN